MPLIRLSLIHPANLTNPMALAQALALARDKVLVQVPVQELVQELVRVKDHNQISFHLEVLRWSTRQ